MSAVTQSTLTPSAARPRVDYPESDGQPIAENTVQFRWIVTIEGGIDALFRDVPDVFVAGDLLWYPVEGDNTVRVAPDTLVVFGRPKGDRGSYMQWLERGIAPQVAFEVISPGNRAGEMLQKFRFYEQYGVEEYYTYDPDRGELAGWRRVGGVLEEVPEMNGWVSPRLGVKFSLDAGKLKICGPDGQPFATYLELVQQCDEMRHAKEREREAKEPEREAKERERTRADRLAAQLKRLGVEPEE